MMTSRPLTSALLRQALMEGWRLARATLAIGIAYTAIFALAGLAMLGGLLFHGFTPFVLAAVGAFMLVGPAILAGFFGIGRAYESGRPAAMNDILAGFRDAAGAVWAIALVCALLFLIFITDAAILYSYLIGATPVWLSELLPIRSGVRGFLAGATISGFVIAFLLFAVSAFSVPLLCERRCNLVVAVTASVRVVFHNFIPAMQWAALLSFLTMGSVLLLPLLLVALPWLAQSSRWLYHQVFPEGA